MQVSPCPTPAARFLNGDIEVTSRIDCKKQHIKSRPCESEPYPEIDPRELAVVRGTCQGQV